MMAMDVWPKCVKVFEGENLCVDGIKVGMREVAAAARALLRGLTRCVIAPCRKQGRKTRLQPRAAPGKLLLVLVLRRIALVELGMVACKPLRIRQDLYCLTNKFHGEWPANVHVL